MANCTIAAFQWNTGIAHSLVIFRSASQISLVAASSLGKWPLVLITLRMRELTDTLREVATSSMALVV